MATHPERSLAVAMVILWLCIGAAIGSFMAALAPILTGDQRSSEIVALACTGIALVARLCVVFVNRSRG